MHNTTSVSVIGLGPMGQAMAGAFLDRGYGVTVWNRTPSRADALIERGAVLAADIAHAVEANELVVLSLTDYDAMYAVLGPAESALAGRTLVNLSSDTPEKARAAALWVQERGAVQLTGGVTAPPYEIGTPESSTFYSGPRDAFDRHREALEVITGRTDYRGEDPGLAALMYQIGMVMFWTALAGYWQAIALAGANGMSASDILPHAAETAGSMPGFLGFYAERIDAGMHEGDVDRLAMGMASVEHVLHTNADSGVDVTLPAALAEVFRKGMDAGHAADSASTLVRVLQARALVSSKD